MKRILFAPLLLLAAVVAGCPENLSTLCPSDTKAEGVFTTHLVLRTNTGADCRVVKEVDGGAADAALFGNPPDFSAAICSKPLDGGGAQVTLALPRSVRPTDTDGGGAFEFTSSTPVTGLCNCTLTIDESIDGLLLPASGGDGGAKYNPDSGFEPLRGFSGVITDHVDGGTDCLCNMPCTAVFDMTATKQ